MRRPDDFVKHYGLFKDTQLEEIQERHRAALERDLSAHIALRTRELEALRVELDQARMTGNLEVVEAAESAREAHVRGLSQEMRRASEAQNVDWIRVVQSCLLVFKEG